jgi:hypothetical protein
MTDCLMAKAHTQQWHSPCGSPNQLAGHASLFWSARPRRDEDCIAFHLHEFIDGMRIVSNHQRLATQLSEILHEVVDETVVVVHH